MLRDLKNTNRNKNQNKVLKKKSKRVKKNLFKKSKKRKKKKKFLRVGGAHGNDIVLVSNFYDKFKKFIHENKDSLNPANNLKYLIEKKPELNNSQIGQESNALQNPPRPTLMRNSSFRGNSAELSDCSIPNVDCISCSDGGITLKFKGVELENKRLINEGSYGKVMKYSGINEKSGEQINLAVKFFFQPKDFNTERRLSQIIFDKLNLKENGGVDKFGVIPSYYSVNCRSIIMHFKDGDLKGLDLTEHSNSSQVKKNIFIQVMTFLIGLAGQDLFYTDLKLENVLYQEVKEGNQDSTYKIYLADIGGIIIGDNKDYSQIAPFSLPYKEHNVFIIRTKEDICNFNFICSFFQQILSFLIYLFDILPRENLGLYWTSFFIVSNGKYTPKTHTDIKGNIDTLTMEIKKNPLFSEIINESVFDNYFFAGGEINTLMTQVNSRPEPSLSSYEMTRDLIVEKLEEIKADIFN